MNILLFSIIHTTCTCIIGQRQVQLESMMHPGPELKPTHLDVERKVGHVDLTQALYNGREVVVYCAIVVNFLTILLESSKFVFSTRNYKNKGGFDEIKFAF